MPKFDSSEVLSYKQAKELTGFADSKFSDPKFVERLKSAGANYDVPFPKHRTFPISSLIAAGLLTEDGHSTKRGYTASSGGYVSARVATLSVLDAEREIDALTDELKKLLGRITEVDEAESSVRAEIEAAKAQIARLREGNEQNLRLAKSLRVLQRNHEARIATLTAHIENRRDAELAETEARLAELEQETAAAKAALSQMRKLNREPQFK